MRTTTLFITGGLIALGLTVGLPYLARVQHEQDLQSGLSVINNLQQVQNVLDAHELVQQELGFRATFPSKPERTQLPSGGWFYLNNHESGVFGVAVQNILPSRAAEDVLAGALQGMLERIPSHQILELTPCLEVPGMRGVDIHIQGIMDGFTVRTWSRVLVGPKQLFIVNATTDDLALVDRFIGSFALLTPSRKPIVDQMPL